MDQKNMSKQLPDIKTNFAEWYNEVVYAAELADHAPVRGSMVIRPYGYAIWERIKDELDAKIKATGHKNAYFPLFIPLSFLQKEAEHVEGFAPELAIVTHAGGKELEEALVVRPTSETMIHFMFAKWIKSWRDLPMKINQWANVVRWEMRPRPFLRTTEFLWQEGHTAHATEQEAHEEALMMWREYNDLIENYLAIPTRPGVKSEQEKFAGADKTYTIEALMQDGKALQMCTSHLISQNFAKAFDMKFQDKEGNLSYPYLTSWGFTTRSVGAVVMMHGDQKGLVLPPKIAPIAVVIIPIYKKGADAGQIREAAQKIYAALQATVRVHLDADEDTSPGSKFYTWELKGVPLRIELGPRDLEAGTVVVVDRLEGKKETVSIDTLAAFISSKLDALQKQMYLRAEERVKAQLFQGTTLAEFGAKLEAEGGFYQVGWCLDKVCEQQLKQYKASTRCLLDEKKHTICFSCGKPSKTDVLVARSY